MLENQFASLAWRIRRLTRAWSLFSSLSTSPMSTSSALAPEDRLWDGATGIGGSDCEAGTGGGGELLPLAEAATGGRLR